jgi:hypothetical protein
MKNPKIYVVGGDLSYINWTGGIAVDLIGDADLLFLTGGNDCTPATYGEKQHPHTFCSPHRDAKELAACKLALELGIPIWGTCRGAQQACVFAGGKLVQHQHNPGPHSMMTNSDSFTVTSTHHQAQFPWNLPRSSFRVLGWTVGISPYHEGGNQEEMINSYVPHDMECEVVYYPKVRALGYQPHPEYGYGAPIYESMITHAQDLLNRLLAGTL